MTSYLNTRSAVPCLTAVRSRLLAAAFLGLLLAALWLPSAASAEFDFQPESVSVTSTSSQAGAHPDLTVSFALKTRIGSDEMVHADGHVKDVRVDLPPGIAGNPLAALRCSDSDVQLYRCPAGSQVGVAVVWIVTPFGILPVSSPVVNVMPSNGHTATLGFSVVAPVRPHVSVRPGDYGLTTTTSDISEEADTVASRLTLWGVPADSSHDAQRDPSLPYPCFGAEDFSACATPTAAGLPRQPFLSNPTACSGSPLQAKVTVDSWENPAAELSETASMPAIEGCGALSFAAKISVQPSVHRVDSPSGYAVAIEVPQNDNPDGLATPDLRRAVVTLPPGVTLSPAAADGLASCSEAQLGLGIAGEAACPQASKIGDVTLVTPDLPDPLTGGIYVLPQAPGDPYRIALAMQGDGVSVKLAGSVHADPATGQLTTTFDENPQLPFSELVLRFKGGARAPLTTPFSCGSAVTTGELTPWSAPFSGGAALPSSAFEVSYDGAGGACPAALPFAPGFSAGVTEVTAGVSSPFVFDVTRADGQQLLSAIQHVTLPPGLTADVGSVPLCTAGDAAAGACGEGSLIGEVLAGAGAGEHPLYLHGKVFLTEGYKGAPYGLAIVVPAVAGPYDLGQVVVRAAVWVSRDGLVSVDADPLPAILKGVPLRLRDVAVNINRPGFMVNPTNCSAMSVAADVLAAPPSSPVSVGSGGIGFATEQGSTAHVSQPFQLDHCGLLGFAPRMSFKILRRAGALSRSFVRRNGIDLNVKLSQKGTGEANIGKVLVALPKQLPSRITTIRQACPAETFDANPAACPAGSVVGTASARTPILRQALTGPAYLVSHGGAAFPDLIAVLQGQGGEAGLRIDLVGHINISASGITSAAFDSVPDVPISSFEMDLPAGPHGILTAKGSVCGQALSAPVTIAGQNGRKLKRSLPIPVQGCKPSISVLRHSVSHGKATIVVRAPFAGTLTASGHGVARTVRRVNAGAASIAVALSPGQRRVLGRHPGRSLRVRVRLVLAGGRQGSVASVVTLLMR